MPIYEFECSSCKNKSEILMRSDDQAKCPKCGGTDMKRLLSEFNSSATKDGGHVHSGGCCSSCHMNTNCPQKIE